MTQKTYLIFGISKGLGKKIVQELTGKQDRVFGISRSRPGYLDTYEHVSWIAADLSDPVQSVAAVRQNIGMRPVDYFIYNVGSWESNAFTDDYDFEQVPQEEIIAMIHSNVTACILSVQSVLQNLKLSGNAKVILIGSTWGLDHHKGKEVVFSATKFALRGMAHALRESLREHRIGVSVLNLGYLANDSDLLQDVATEQDRNLIPLDDVLLALKFIMATSGASCVKEIHMPAMSDTNV